MSADRPATAREESRLIRALVFDFDGLLLDTESPLYASWTEIYREAGLDVSLEEWAGILGTAADPPAAYEFLERRTNHPIDRQALRERRAAREALLLARELPLPGACEILAKARERDLRLAVASSSDKAWVESHLRRFALLDYFDALVCAEDVRHTKPASDLYVEALRRLGVRSEEAIAFEDSAHGVEAAKRAGLFCVAVPNAVTRHADLSRADVILSSLLARPLAQLIRDAEGTPRADLS